MKKYEKPVVMINEELAEGVYAASGCFGDCYEVKIVSHNIIGNTHVYQFDATHKVCEEHGSHCGSEQVLIVKFDKNVDIKEVSTDWISWVGDGTDTLYLTYRYTQNETGNIGLGNLTVAPSDGTDGLEIDKATLTLTCNHIKNW